MGLLDKLWDDVLAGPQPEKGLGRLRKEKLMLNIDASEIEEDSRMMVLDRRSSGEFRYAQDEAHQATQRIAVVKPPVLKPYPNDESLSSPSPSGSSVPLSPFLTSPLSRSRENVWKTVFQTGNNKVLDRKGSAKFDEEPPISPTVYDWVVISVLD